MKSQNATTTTLPSFADYVDDRKYLKNVSLTTVAWYRDAWRAFGPYIETLLASGGRINDTVRTLVAALREKGVRPVSINSYLTCVRAYLNWLHRQGHLTDKPRVELLKFEHKVIATFTPDHVQRMIAFRSEERRVGKECRSR